MKNEKKRHVIVLSLSLADLERKREKEGKRKGVSIVLALLQKFSRIDAAFVPLKQNIHDIMTYRSTPEKI